MKSDPELKETLNAATKSLEEARCLEAELEASLLLASSLLGHPPGESTIDASSLPGGVQDAWAVLSEASSKPDETAATPATLITTAMEEAMKDHDLALGRGQLGKATHIATLSAVLHRATSVAHTLSERRRQDAPLLQKAMTMPKSSAQWMAIMDERLRKLRAYHARHEVEQQNVHLTKRQKVGNPAADGYDLASIVASEVTPIRQDVVFTPDEVLGRYLDLKSIHDSLNTKHIFSDKEGHVLPLEDVLSILSKGLSTAISEQDKLKERKKYLRFLASLQAYLEGFLNRTCPLLNIDSVVKPAVEEFEEEWRQKGGVTGWEIKTSEAAWVDSDTGPTEYVDLSRYTSAQELEKHVDGDTLKTELSRLGLKCGGTVSDRAKRLFLTKDTPWDELPKKLFAKASVKNGNDSIVGERRVDLARQEVVVMALLDQLRPTLEASIRRAERRQTQTLNEREQELEEEMHGSSLPDDTNKGGHGGESDEEDEAPIYNPKGVPLGWDGKPIPYWLFKLHGLNHFYPCEICGGESYRGRRNFEKHFAESKHAYGMKCLGIPNTKHFHGVTKIEDAQQLWKSLHNTLEQDQFDGATEEEYEDSHGNVLSRATYEDLARQGLL
jgi:splicing factor 3A subunit 3